jgi:hypothetical protein
VSHLLIEREVGGKKGRRKKERNETDYEGFLMFV